MQKPGIVRVWVRREIRWEKKDAVNFDRITSNNNYYAIGFDGGFNGLMGLAGLNTNFRSIHMVREKQLIKIPCRKTHPPEAIDIIDLAPK
jgi:hypothetical protein